MLLRKQRQKDLPCQRVNQRFLWSSCCCLQEQEARPLLQKDVRFTQRTHHVQIANSLFLVGGGNNK